MSGDDAAPAPGQTAAPDLAKLLLEAMTTMGSLRSNADVLGKVLEIEKTAWDMAFDLSFKRGRGGSASTDDGILALQEKIARQLRRRIGLAPDPRPDAPAATVSPVAPGPIATPEGLDGRPH